MRVREILESGETTILWLFTCGDKGGLVSARTKQSATNKITQTRELTIDELSILYVRKLVLGTSGVLMIDF